MNVPSFEFLGFVLIGALLFNLAGKGLPSRLIMLALNLAFFATFLNFPSALSDFLLSIAPYAAFLLMGYVGVTVLRGQNARVIYVGFIAATIFAFFCLKRYSFVPPAFELSFLYETIGLSYVFFRVLHLIIDVGQGAIGGRISPLSYLNYTLSFPALVAGPIQLYPDYKKSEAERPPLDLFVLARAAERIVAGLFKVLILYVLLHYWQGQLIAALPTTSDDFSRIVTIALIGALYPLIIYANFSGYTDFVIGAARLLRIKLPENFDNPFAAANLIDFWARWHMTLSNWLKTYVYTPLLMALMRRLPSAKLENWFAVAAYFVTFFLVGAWHGQTAEFLFFGMLHGGGVAGNKLWQISMQGWLTRKGYRALSQQPLYRAVCRGFTFTYFAFTLLWFWSTWADVGGLVNAAGLGGFLLAWAMVFVTATIALAGMVWARDNLAKINLADDPLLSSRYVRTASVTAMAAITVVAVTLLAAPAPEIVYRNF
jgi:alginate O-acetyltransferase complex protein AlgI